MKIPAFLLAASLAANAALGFFLVNRSAHETGSSAAPAASLTAKSDSANAAKLSSNPLDETSTQSGANPQAWSQLTTGDLAAAVARLRAENLPPALLRAIVRMLISERADERRQVIIDAINAQPWWIGTANISDPKIAALRRQLSRDQEELLTQLLGPDNDLTDVQRAAQRRSNGDLPQAKVESLRRITNDYAQMTSEVSLQSQGFMLAEDRAQLALLEREKRADIAKLLSPAELFEFDLRSSPSANELRGRLAAFDPTESEYRALFQLQQTVDDQFPPVSTLSVEQRTQRTQALAKLQPQIETALGASRYAEYKETTDGNFLTASNLVRRFDLPASATREIIAVQKDINQRAETVRGDKSLTVEARNAQLVTLGQEANTRLTPILGDNALSAYKQGGGGWINSLVRPPTPPPAAVKR